MDFGSERESADRSRSQQHCAVRAFSSGALGLEISASEEQGKSKTISNPRVLTQDRKEAKN